MSHVSVDPLSVDLEEHTGITPHPLGTIPHPLEIEAHQGVFMLLYFHSVYFLHYCMFYIVLNFVFCSILNPEYSDRHVLK